MRKPNAMHSPIDSDLKRAIDLAIASLGLILLSPLFAAVALAIYLNIGQPVVFRQRRAGYRARPFTILKFRTMQDFRLADGVAPPDGERTTGLGRFLRRTSLDELPQLWNVVRGDMSLVGPRPLIGRHISLCDAEQVRRLEARPGITGWAQVNGRNTLSWEEKFRHDCWYVDHWSHRLDLEIALLTVITVIRCEGVDEMGVVTAARSGVSAAEEA